MHSLTRGASRDNPRGYQARMFDGYELKYGSIYAPVRKKKKKPMNHPTKFCADSRRNAQTGNPENHRSRGKKRKRRLIYFINTLFSHRRLRLQKWWKLKNKI